MNRKKMGARIILGAFLILLCFSGLLWSFVSGFTDSTNYENREMAEKPELTLDTYGEYAQEYENYYNDKIPFRNTLITLNSAIDYFVFHRSSSTSVIPGKNNWLFYCKESDGDPLGSYQGKDLLTEEELKALADNCVAQRDFLAAQGIEFVIFIGPNKERIYSEYMPEQYGKPTEHYRAEQIVEYLQEHTDLRVVYPYNELMQAKDQIKENLYYKTDTHWNALGGYVGAAALLRELGIQMPSLTDSQIEIIHGENTSGDLAGMLNLSKQLKRNDTEYAVIGYNAHNVQWLENDFFGVFSFQADNADPRRIYVYRDSFSTAMASYIGSQFAGSYLRHCASYTYEDCIAQNPDVFVFETVERYAGSLATFQVEK